MKAFIGHSFDKNDTELITKFFEFIESLDIKCIDAKKAKSKTVEDKITELISGCEIFVGIFTRAEPICQEKARKWLCNPLIKTMTYGTSDWVIQESGFALGSGRHLILLKENVVRDLPKLQGNLEYIPFERNNIEETYIKISQMVSDIKLRANAESTQKQTEEAKSADSNNTDKEVERKEEKSQDARGASMRKLNIALWGKNDYKEAQKIFNEELVHELDKNEKDKWWAYILRKSCVLGDDTAPVKLQKLVEENSEKPNVIIELAYRYKEMREYQKAKDIFLRAKDKYDVNDNKHKSSIINCYIQAAWCLFYDEDVNAALAMLKELLFNSQYEEHKSMLFEAMARISKENGNIENFLIYSEAAIDINPNNTTLRFDMAYAYSENGNEKMALLHYKKLTDSTKHRSGLNNIGVSYQRLKLNEKSVSSYCEAAKEKETLAMANLAYLYIDAGFSDNARKLINEAYKLSSEGVYVHPNIGSAKQKLDTLIEDENKREKEILLGAEKEKKFRLNYSKAFSSESIITKNKIEGTWKTHWGDFELKFDEGEKVFSIDGSKKIEVNTYSSFFSSPGLSSPAKIYNDRHVKITGNIENMSGKYSIDVEDVKGSMLTTDKIRESTGYMIINENSNRIETMEKTKEGKTEFIQWEKTTT